jgi:hypothetical protein
MLDDLFVPSNVVDPTMQPNGLNFDMGVDPTIDGICTMQQITLILNELA